MKDKILITGACGQIGTELTAALRSIYGDSNVIATDLRPYSNEIFDAGPFEIFDVLDRNRLIEIMDGYQINQIYHLAAMLSAKAEQQPVLGWELNMNSFLFILEASKEKAVKKIFWPSSIGAFGPNSPRTNTPQYTTMDPTSVYGISKKAGEGLCAFYNNMGMDIRSVRYPGLISYKSLPGGGTTDYAVEIFHQALKKGQYSCFLNSDTRLPMMYMNDAIRGTLELMETEKQKLSVQTSYNFSGSDFNPEELALEIKKHIEGFNISYQPDFRQKIAESWPESIDDSIARKDWGWKPEFNLQSMTEDMIVNLAVMY